MNNSNPYINFKFRVKWEGRYVAGVSKVSALKSTTELVKHREGSDPTISRKSPGHTEYAAITLERGVTHDVEFERWANKVWNSESGLGSEVSLDDFRKDIIIDVYNEAGQLALSYKVYRCWVSEFQALPDMDANANVVAIQTIKLENEGCERYERNELTELTFVQRLTPKMTWNDTVLPFETLDLLHQIADQVRRRMLVHEEWGFRYKMNRGLGISALFVDESGTGKTMSAEVLANDLQLDLYLINLSAVVSKYIGETEKNLRKVFDAAEESSAILFFDEADTIFGKRSEVKDSHERYSNIESSYLLQRMGDYQGLVILAIKEKSSLDQAFLRRVGFIVNFPFPSPSSVG